MSIELRETSLGAGMASDRTAIPAGAARMPQVKIRPPGQFSPLAMKELMHYQDLFWALAVRDVKLRYKQTALGVIWVLLQPLMGAAIFTFVFGWVAGMSSGKVNY